MSNADDEPQTPDFRKGVSLSALADGAMLKGRVGDEPALVVRRGDDLFILGATCTHYGGPLGEGLVVGETVRCPWHHACFNLRSGEAVRAPALDPVDRWSVEVRDGVAYARDKLDRVAPGHVDPGAAPESVVIIGGGPAGNAAAETLRREGYDGPITMLSADSALPADRPNLSKDYLAGKAEEEWTMLRPADFYRDNRIEVRLDTRVAAIDPAERSVTLADGSRRSYGALLLATGATPVTLDVPGADRPQVHYLRTLDDSRALIAKAEKSKTAVIIGASFIGLEAASSLRARGLAVHVIGPEEIPMARVLGPELGKFVRSVHEQHEVVFHLGRTATAIDEGGVTLDDGEHVDGDLVVVGIGVRPATQLAEQAGLTLDRGVLVNEFLETSAPHIFAAGDIARWPDPHSGQAIRVEHFVVAERHGQTAARNMLGRRERFDDVPFFWTEQHDFGIAYVGHAEKWDDLAIDGSIEERDCSVTFYRDGRKLAVAVLRRDLEGLRAEAEFERALDRSPTRPAQSARQEA